MPGPLDPKFIGQVPNGGTGRDFFPTGCFVAGNGKQKLQTVLAAKTGSVGMTSQDSMLQAAPALGIGDCWNLAVKYVNGRFSLTSSSFRALGKDAQGNYNIGFCRIPLTTGASEVFELRADQFFDDSSAADSDIFGEEFGTTSGVAWGNSRPFYIYGCNVTDDPRNGFRCFISPNPTLTSSPALAANIGYQDVVAATPSDSAAFFLCPEDATIYTDKPCVLLGSFSMTKNASDDWAVTTLAKRDGIGRFNEQTSFTMPSNQNGAATTSHLKNNGGTAPLFSTENYFFRLQKNGICINTVMLSGDGGGDGAGAVSTQLALPYVAENVSGASTQHGVMDIENVTFSQISCAVNIPPGTTTAFFQRNTSATTIGGVLNADFLNGARTIRGNFSFVAF